MGLPDLTSGLQSRLARPGSAHPAPLPRKWRWGLLAGLLAAAPLSAGALALSSPTPFLIPGEAIELDVVAGQPGATVLLLRSSTPAFVPAGALGTLYLAPGTFQIAAAGRLNGTGTGRLTLPVPADAAPGARWFVQALALGGGQGLSNAVPLRVETGPPVGARGPRALAVTPDGRRAYVVHQVDGTVSVLDAQNDALLTELPITTGARSIPHRPVDVAVSPDGRHVFVASATADFLSVVEVASASVIAEIPVPRGSRRIAFDFDGGERRVYVANQTANAILVLREETPGTWTRLADLRLQGRMPEALEVLADGRIVVAHRVLGELELIDPTATPSERTVARTAIEAVPFDLALAADGELRVAAFVLSSERGVEGFNRVLRVDPQTLTVLGVQFENTGTDYKAISTRGQLQVVAATANGVVVVADLAGNVLDRVILAPGEPHATPEDVAFVAHAPEEPPRIYVLDFFRETLRPVSLASGPPYLLGEPIVLAWSGEPRTPLGPATSPAEDGAWLFTSVSLVGGDAADPNPVTCQSCHIDGVADNLPRPRQVPPMWGLFDTAPYGSSGGQPDLSTVIAGALERHNKSGIAPIPEAQALFEAWLEVFQPPASPYLDAQGQPGEDAAAGRLLFERIGCEQCHQAPLFIPEAPNPRNIEAGIGTGIAPVNVPSLRGVWASAPYLHDGRARTLWQVFANPQDTHGMQTAGLTPGELGQLVAYLRTL